MQGFEDVTIGWGGESYVVPADGQLMLIAKIEAAFRTATGKPAIQALLQAGGPEYAALAMAFGAALRHAGASVTDDELYLSIQEGFAKGENGAAVAVQETIMALLSIISPPMGATLRGGDSGGEKKKAPTSKD
jgi:hypothetical protein